MKKFYQASLQDDFGNNGYPAVIPESMKTLETLLAASFTVEEVKQRFIHAFDQLILTCVSNWTPINGKRTMSLQMNGQHRSIVCRNK